MDKTMKLFDYLELIQLDRDNYNSKTEYMIDVVSIYLDKDPEIVGSFPVDKLIKIFQEIDLPLPPAKDFVVINNEKFYKLPFKRITLGEWIDLEHFITRVDTLAKVAAILYRRLEVKDVLYGEDIYEPYGLWLDKRVPYFNNLDYKDVAMIKREYIEWRDTVINSYGILFNTMVEEEDLEGLSEEDLKEVEEAKKIDAKHSRFVWEKLIMELCDNNLSEFTKVLNTPLLLTFNVLSMLKLGK